MHLGGVGREESMINLALIARQLQNFFKIKFIDFREIS